MLLSLCLWSPREEEQTVHLYGLFLGLKTDGSQWDFKEIRLKKMTPKKRNKFEELLLLVIV